MVSVSLAVQKLSVTVHCRMLTAGVSSNVTVALGSCGSENIPLPARKDHVPLLSPGIKVPLSAALSVHRSRLWPAFVVITGFTVRVTDAVAEQPLMSVTITV